MFIKYYFTSPNPNVGYEKSVVEVDDEIGNIIIEARREEYRNNSKFWYHNLTLGLFSLNGGNIGALDPAYLCMESGPDESDRARMKAALALGLKKLTPTQLRRLTLFAEGMTTREIAKAEGVSNISVFESIEAAKKKILKIYQKNTLTNRQKT